MDKNTTIIFLHIPKNAGTSLRNIISRFYDDKDIYYIYTRTHNFHDIDDFKALPAAEKNKLRIICGHVSYGLHRDIPRRSSYATILRDPLERMISLYTHVSTDHNHPYYKKIKADNLGIGDFIRRGVAYAFETDNHQTRIISGRSAEYGKCTTDMLETAKNNLKDNFSVVGITEYFIESVLLMKSAYGWKVPFYISLKRRNYGLNKSPFYDKTNVSVNRHRMEDLSSEEISTIREFNKLDMELYDYAKRLFFDEIRRQGTLFMREVERLKSSVDMI